MRWGMPQSIRVDNGMPLGDPQRKSIPELSLWLLAKEIKVIFNRPRQPTDNAKVERLQQTTKNWGAIEHAENLADLNTRLEKSILIQREKFKVSRLNSQTRLEAYPNLSNNPCHFDEHRFKPQMAYQRLANCSFVRKVSTQGQVSVYGQKYSLPKHYKKSFVSIKFDPVKISWSFLDENNRLIVKVEATNLKPHNIRNLSVGQRTY